MGSVGDARYVTVETMQRHHKPRQQTPTRIIQHCHKRLARCHSDPENIRKPHLTRRASSVHNSLASPANAEVLSSPRVSNLRSEMTSATSYTNKGYSDSRDLLSSPTHCLRDSQRHMSSSSGALNETYGYVQLCEILPQNNQLASQKTHRQLCKSKSVGSSVVSYEYPDFKFHVYDETHEKRERTKTSNYRTEIKTNGSSNPNLTKATTQKKPLCLKVAPKPPQVQRSLKPVKSVINRMHQIPDKVDEKQRIEKNAQNNPESIFRDLTEIKVEDCLFTFENLKPPPYEHAAIESIKDIVTQQPKMTTWSNTSLTNKSQQPGIIRSSEVISSFPEPSNSAQLVDLMNKNSSNDSEKGASLSSTLSSTASSTRCLKRNESTSLDDNLTCNKCLFKYREAIKLCTCVWCLEACCYHVVIKDDIGYKDRYFQDTVSCSGGVKTCCKRAAVGLSCLPCLPFLSLYPLLYGVGSIFESVLKKCST